VVQIYCSTLTSHLTSPNQKVILNSILEIADESSDLTLAIDKGYALDVIFKVRLMCFRYFICWLIDNLDISLKQLSERKFLMQTTESGRSRIVDGLKNNSRLFRCSNTVACLETLQKGNAVYAAVSLEMKTTLAKFSQKCFHGN
jgi:hypothetical protein